jgi:hypothetical protein
MITLVRIEYEKAILGQIATRNSADQLMMIKTIVKKEGLGYNCFIVRHQNYLETLCELETAGVIFDPESVEETYSYGEVFKSFNSSISLFAYYRIWELSDNMDIDLDYPKVNSNYRDLFPTVQPNFEKLFERR